METVSNFVSIVLAKLTGDKAKEIALRNEKKARAALRGQISALESEQVNLDEKLEDAREAFNNALYPAAPIESSEAYIESIVRAQENVDCAEENLADNINSIEFYKSLLEKL